MPDKNIAYLRIYIRMFKNFFKFAPAAGVVNLLSCILWGLFPAFTALILSMLFDEAYSITSGVGEAGRLLLLGAVYLAAYAAINLWGFASGLVIELGADKTQVYYRYLMCVKLSKMPLLDYEDTSIKEMQARAEYGLYSGGMNGVVRSSFILVMNSVLNVVSVSAVLARYSLWFLPLCLVSVLPYLVTRIVRGKEFYSLQYGQAKKNRRLAYLWGLFTDRRSVKELRTAGADGYVFEKWTQCRDETLEEHWALSKKNAVSMLLCDTLRVTGYGACVALALVLVLKGIVGVGVFGACIAAFLSLQSAVQSIFIDGGYLPSQLAFANDFFTFIDLPDEDTSGQPYHGLHSSITMRNVSFSYPNAARCAVNNVSLEIKKGEKIAILGENGSGKTTLTKLLLGMYPPSEGAVFYDDTDAAALDKPELYKTVSAVAQNFVQYKLPLRDNIAMSRVEAVGNDEEIKTALRNAGLAELLDTAGLDGELGTGFGGGDISGGQWQKLAIARGLFRDSGLIILDEPTSALDPLIETEILSKFIELAKDKTAVIISHRVGLCRLVDRIVVMKDGQIAEIGTHDNLLACGGEYSRLFTAQEKWYRQDKKGMV